MVADYVNFVKDRIRVYKATFAKYCQVHKDHQASFDSIKTAMTQHSVSKFLFDFQISKKEFRTQQQIKQLIIAINQRQGSGRVADLDFEGWIDFMLQLGHAVQSSQSSNPAEFMSELFDRLANVSLNSEQPLLQHVFKKPEPRRKRRKPISSKRRIQQAVAEDFHSAHPSEREYSQGSAEVDLRPESERVCEQVVADLVYELFGPVAVEEISEERQPEQVIERFESHRMDTEVLAPSVKDQIRIIANSGDRSARSSGEPAAMLTPSSRPREVLKSKLTQGDEGPDEKTRARNQRYSKYARTPKPQRLNQLQKIKLESKLDDLRRDEIKEFQRAQRQAVLKRQLDEYHQSKRAQQLEFEEEYQMLEAKKKE